MPHTTLALIGLGQWGKNYLTTAQKISGCRIKYVCSPHQHSVMTSRFNTIHLTDYKKLLRHNDIDGIIIATPADTHFAIAKYFLTRGYNILIEKPLATSLRQAKRLDQLSFKKQPVVLVGHVYLYHPVFRTALKQLPKVGKLIYLELEGCNFGPFRKDTTALWDWAPHDISLCLKLLERSPDTVAAWGVRSKASGRVTWDMISARLDFGDLTAFLKIGWLSPVKKRRLTIVGEKGAIVFDDTTEPKLTVFTGRNFSSVSSPSYLKDEPLTVELLEFISRIQAGRKPRSDLQFGVTVVSIVEALERSLDAGSRRMRVKI